MYSADGIAWTFTNATEANGWQSVCYGGGKFVAVASNGTNRVTYSTDGIAWTAASAAVANSWKSVCYGGGKFVAVAYSSTTWVMYSADGITWTAASAAEANAWRSVCYGTDKFVAVASNGTNRVMYSADGITWTATSAPEANAWRSVCYGTDKFVAVASSGSNHIMYSADGIRWTSTNCSGVGSSLYAVCYGNGRFVAVTQDYLGDSAMYSTDGITWTAGTSALNRDWNSICYGTDKFVAVGDDTSDCAMYIYSTSTTKINNHYHTIIVPKSVYASGTPYTLTNISALVDFGTIDPTLTLEETKFYKIRAGIKIEYVGATLAANQVITLKLRKTSGTPADIPNSSTTLTTEILTTITKTMGVFPLPEVVCFLAVSDIIQIWASIDVVPSAGSIQISAASIVAD
jgi:predicted secreted protein